MKGRKERRRARGKGKEIGKRWAAGRYRREKLYRRRTASAAKVKEDKLKAWTSSHKL
jgi:hypothetical protein